MKNNAIIKHVNKNAGTTDNLKKKTLVGKELNDDRIVIFFAESFLKCV